MFQHIYQLVYENGDIVMEVRSDYTYLNFDIYAQKFVVPMMHALAHALHEDRVQRTDGDCGELQRVYYTGITEGDPE